MPASLQVNALTVQFDKLPAELVDIILAHTFDNMSPMEIYSFALIPPNPDGGSLRLLVNQALQRQILLVTPFEPTCNNIYTHTHTLGTQLSRLRDEALVFRLPSARETSRLPNSNTWAAAWRYGWPRQWGTAIDTALTQVSAWHHITIDLFVSNTPQFALSCQYPNLRTLRLRGRPRRHVNHTIPLEWVSVPTHSPMCLVLDGTMLRCPMEGAAVYSNNVITKLVIVNNEWSRLFIDLFRRTRFSMPQNLTIHLSRKHEDPTGEDFPRLMSRLSRGSPSLHTLILRNAFIKHHDYKDSHRIVQAPLMSFGSLPVLEIPLPHIAHLGDLLSSPNLSSITFGVYKESQHEYLHQKSNLDTGFVDLVSHLTPLWCGSINNADASAPGRCTISFKLEKPRNQIITRDFSKVVQSLVRVLRACTNEILVGHDGQDMGFCIGDVTIMMRELM